MPVAAAGEDSQAPQQDKLSSAEAFISSLARTANSSSSSSDNNSSSGGSASQSSSVLRGPALAHVELAKRKVQLGMGDEQQLVQALLHHHDR